MVFSDLRERWPVMLRLQEGLRRENKNNSLVYCHHKANKEQDVGIHRHPQAFPGCGRIILFHYWSFVSIFVQSWITWCKSTSYNTNIHTCVIQICKWYTRVTVRGVSSPDKSHQGPETAKDAVDKAVHDARWWIFSGQVRHVLHLYRALPSTSWSSWHHAPVR